MPLDFVSQLNVVFPVSVSQLIPILQTAIGPVILISGIGLLLLTMTNRLVHVVDRARVLHLDLHHASGENQKKIVNQIAILWKRTHLIRLAIVLASVSALFSSVLIIILFAAMLCKIELGWLLTLCFILSISCLMGSLMVFIHDINRSLIALGMELYPAGTKRSQTNDL